MIESDLPITLGDVPAPKPTCSAIYLLDRKQVEHYWPRIEAELLAEPELWSNWWTLESLFEGIISDVLQVWVVSNSNEKLTAVFMTQILAAPAGKVLQVFWIRGKLPDGALNRISLTLDHFGRHHGCFQLCVTGRKGWERKLRNLGARTDSVCLVRPIHPMVRN